jgi:signal transduction histidine kinase/CheY-like chemotaxis protein
MGEIIRINLRRNVPSDQGELASGAVSDGAGDYGEGMPDRSPGGQAYLVTDQAGRILDVSDAAVNLLRYEKDALLDLHVAGVIGRLDEAVLDVIIKAAPSGHTLMLDALCYRNDGTALSVEVLVQDVVEAKAGDWRIGFVMQDALPLRSTDRSGVEEARLARADRLEMAGTLAGQIAHDFNNLLTPLLAYPELIRREVSSNKTVCEYLDIMEKTTGDMTRLTHQLLSLARRGQVGSDIFNVNDLVVQVVRLMQSVLPRGVSVELDLADGLLGVKGSKDQMRRVLENLCQNAVDAMGDGGTLEIRTENVYLDAPVAQYGVVNVGEYVKISIIDSGTGIPDAIKDKIFDPFFTTKRGSEQRGSGLGLSVVHGVMRDHQGYVDLETAQRKGTSFFLYLPITRQVPAQAAGVTLPRGTERILVVDDDDLQVQVLASLIGALGYSVSGVTSGEECLKRIRDGGERYDLVILDMVMAPGMDGLETYAELRKLNAHQRVILISGFTRAASNIAKAQQMGAGTYLRKPLTIESLAATIRSELDKGRVDSQGQPMKQPKNRILIVDDEPMIRKLFGMIILSEFADMIVDQVSNGREAIESFQKGVHSVIIMDLQMPEMDGRETFMEIGRLCSQNSWMLPSVIFCSGFSPPESLNTIIREGGIHCLLRKPVKADVLLHAVRQRLRA